MTAAHLSGGENPSPASPDDPRTALEAAPPFGTGVARREVMHPFPHLYTVTSTAAPEGDIVLHSQGVPALATITPPEFDGPGGLWSPETLLVAAVADCFLLTFRGIARASNMRWTSISVDCIGTLERPERVTQFTKLELRARVLLPPTVAEDQARRILVKAEETCLITQSLKAKTHLLIEIER